MKIMFVTLAREEEPKGIWNTPCKLNNFLKNTKNKTKFLKLPKKVNFFSLFYYFLSFIFSYLKFKPDAIIAFHPIGAVPIFYKRLRLIRAPIIYYWWDFDIECMGKNWNASSIAFLEFYCVRKADKVFTNSLFQKEIGKKIGVECLYFPLGAEDYFQKDAPKITLPGKNKFKLLFFGDINKYKNMRELILGMNGLKADLIVIGPQSENLGINVPSNVYMIGFKPHNELPSYISSADIIAIPTDQDGTLKMFESLKMGKCILAFQGRIGYVLAHLTNAYLCKDFKEGIIYLMSHPEVIKKIEKNNSKIKISAPEEIFKMQLKEIEKILRR